jgi:hypothetical protein
MVPIQAKYDTQRYLVIGQVIGMLQTGLLTFLDLLGYYKIRKLLKEALSLTVNTPTTHHRSNSIHRESSSCPCLSHEEIPLKADEENRENYKHLLTRMWRFHAVIFALCFMVWCVEISNISTYMKNPNAPIPKPDPNVFVLDFTEHATLPGLVLFVWWAWIPWSAEKDGVNSTSKPESRSEHSRPGHNRGLSSEVSPVSRQRVYSATIEKETPPETPRFIGEEKQPFIADDPLAISLPSPSQLSPSVSESTLELSPLQISDKTSNPGLQPDLTSMGTSMDSLQLPTVGEEGDHDMFVQ